MLITETVRPSKTLCKVQGQNLQGHSHSTTSSKHCTFSGNLSFVNWPIIPTSRQQKLPKHFLTDQRAPMGKAFCRFPLRRKSQETLKSQDTSQNLSLPPFQKDTPFPGSPRSDFSFFFSCSLAHFANNTSLLLIPRCVLFCSIDFILFLFFVFYCTKLRKEPLKALMVTTH